MLEVFFTSLGFSFLLAWATEGRSFWWFPLAWVLAGAGPFFAAILAVEQNSDQFGVELMTVAVFSAILFPAFYSAIQNARSRAR